MSNVRFVNQGQSAEIFLYDQIGEGIFGGISEKEFAEQLKALGKVSRINLRINSPGGDVFAGHAIYNMLARHPADVIVDIDGVAASIASVIAMAGNEINMAANAMMMVHDPYGFTAGSAGDMRATAALLDQIKGLIVNTYAHRTRSDAGEISRMMSAETWMTPSDAVELGFADAVTQEQEIEARYQMRARTGVSLPRYKNAPQAVLGVDRPARDMRAVKLVAQARRITR